MSSKSRLEPQSDVFKNQWGGVGCGGVRRGGGGGAVGWGGVGVGGRKACACLLTMVSGGADVTGQSAGLLFQRFTT